MKFKVLISILILTTFFISSCDNSCDMSRQINMLSVRKWMINSYIDYSINQEMSLTPEQYEFCDDGSVMKVRGNDTIYCEWSIPECGYLKISARTFKIVELSRKIMVLRYGNLDFIYRSMR